MSSLLTGTVMTVFSAPADVFTTDRYRDDYLVHQLMSSPLTGTVMTVFSAPADVFTTDRYRDDCI